MNKMIYKVNLGYMKQKVCLVGLASGLILGPLGYTHCCVEDLSIMRSIPNMAVISPADCGETAKTIYASLLYKDSVYIRLTGGSNSDIIYTKDYEFLEMTTYRNLVYNVINCQSGSRIPSVNGPSRAGYK